MSADEAEPQRRAGSAVERAFQVAAGCATLDDIRRTLRAEGCAQVDDHLSAPSLRRELALLLRGGRTNVGAGGLTPAPIA